MRLTLSLFLLLMVAPGSTFAQSNKVSFYFSAHPDDWQLFMGVNAFKDIEAASSSNNARVVFIYTTAGEANCYGGTTVNKRYYLARQEGANRSVQFCSDIYSPHADWSTGSVMIPGVTNHAILQLKYKNIVCYFLRLPDGCFEQTPNTMAKLANGLIASLTATDTSTTYYGYKDLVETVRNIVDYESSTLKDPEVWIQASDWDESVNPQDHPDHRQTGRLATEIAAKVGYANVALFEGYNTCNKPSNLAPEEVAMEASLHSQVAYGMTKNGYPTEWDPQSQCGHVEWTNKNYYRIFSTATTAKTATSLLKLNPNPAGNNINLAYEVTDGGPVTIVLYNMLGNKEATIVDEKKGTGVYTMSYDMTPFASGNYIIHGSIAGHLYTLKFTKL